MTERNRFTNVVDTLASAKASMRCQDMVTALESLGFEVRDGKKQGHKLLMHDGIPGFFVGQLHLWPRPQSGDQAGLCEQYPPPAASL